MGDTKPELRLVEPDPATGASDATDDALMLAAAADNPQAFAALVRRYEATVRRYCAGMLRHEALAREAAQEVFLRLWGHRQGYRADGRFRAFLFSLARNHCRSRLRRQRVRRLFGQAEGETTAFDESSLREPAAPPLDDAHLVRAALASLPDGPRQALLLRYYAGLDYDELAKVLGLTASGARSRVFYALKRLAEIIDPHTAGGAL